ncbi:Fc receptor-like B [Melospiza melodia melodia]
MCHRPGTGLSPPVVVSDDLLVLQVPAGVLLEGDTMTLRCRCGHWNHIVTRVQFYQDEKEVRGFINRTELSLFPLQLHHSGHYSCGGLVGSWQSRSAAVTVKVYGEHFHGWNSSLLTPPMTLPSRLRVTVLTSSLLP